MIRLTPYDLSKLPGSEWKDGRWYYDPHEVARAQLKKVIDEDADGYYAVEGISEMFLASPDTNTCYVLRKDDFSEFRDRMYKKWQALLKEIDD